jgi:hypothetical protein
MIKLRRHSWVVLVFSTLLTAAALKSGADENTLPQFGRDTVLVWRIQNQNLDSSFVVRIAEFKPDRFLEWEDSGTQGTLFMPSRDIQGAKNYVGQNLFEAGVDMKSENATTLWLSGRIYRDLKTTGKSKCQLDGVSGLMTYLGNDKLTIDVNRSPMEISVIKVSNGRGSDLWFVDQEENPLLVKHVIRQFVQVLASVTTNRTNTLRWIKGKKLENPPH